MDQNGIAIFVLAFGLIVWLLGRKRSRHIPARSKRLARTKLAKEFHSEPSNRGKRLRYKDYEFDHYVPFRDGGDHEPENIRLISKRENRKKGARNPQGPDRMRAILILAGVIFLLYLLSRH